MDALCFSLWFSMSVCSVDEARQSGTMLGCWWVLPCPSAPQTTQLLLLLIKKCTKACCWLQTECPMPCISLSVAACCLNVGIGYIFSWLRVVFGGSLLMITILVMIVGSLIPIRSIAWHWHWHDLTTQHGPVCFAEKPWLKVLIADLLWEKNTVCLLK